MSEKIKNIEFLRFIFSLMIVYAHIFWWSCSVLNLYSDYTLYTNLYNKAVTSFLSVEYFFIISGFFLFFHLKNKTDDTFSFALSRLKRLWPLFALSVIIIWVLSLFKMCDFYPYSNVINLLLLYRTGIDFSTVNNCHSWFICILFWCSVFYHYIYRNFNTKSVNLIIALITFYSFTTLIFKSHGIIYGTHGGMISGIPGGFLRGASSIGLGYFLGMFWNNISGFVEEFKPYGKFNSLALTLFFSVIEIYLFLFLINNSLFHHLNFQNNFILIIAFSILLLLFVSRKGILSKLLNNNVSAFLGKFSYSIYILQIVGFIIAQRYLWTNKVFVYTHPYLNILFTLLMCLVIGIFGYYAEKFLINKMKNPPPESFKGRQINVFSINLIRRNGYIYG